MTLAISMTGDDLTDGELLLDELASRVRTPNDAHSLADIAGLGPGLRHVLDRRADQVQQARMPGPS